MKENPAYLYHGTGIYCLARIVETDSLSNVSHPESADEHSVLHFTDNFRDATSLIARNLSAGEGGILVLDRKSLSQTYEFIEAQDSQHDDGDLKRSNNDVIAMTKEIKPLSEHLVSIVFDPQVATMAMFRKHMEDAYNNSGWPTAWGAPMKAPGRQKMLEAFDAMAASPFLNARAFTPESYPHLGNWIDVPADADV